MTRPGIVEEAEALDRDATPAAACCECGGALTPGSENYGVHANRQRCVEHLRRRLAAAQDQRTALTAEVKALRAALLPEEPSEETVAREAHAAPGFAPNDITITKPISQAELHRVDSPLEGTRVRR